MQRAGKKIAEGHFGAVYTFDGFQNDLIKYFQKHMNITIDRISFQRCYYFANTCGSQKYDYDNELNYQDLVYKIILNEKEETNEIESINTILKKLNVNIYASNNSNSSDIHFDILERRRKGNINFIKDNTIFALVQRSDGQLDIMTHIKMLCHAGKSKYEIKLIPYAKCLGTIDDKRLRLSFVDIIQLVHRVTMMLYNLNNESLHHFDIKPGNILYYDNNGLVDFKLADYGLVSEEYRTSDISITCPVVISNKNNYFNIINQLYTERNLPNIGINFHELYDDYRNIQNKEIKYEKMDIYSLGITLLMIYPNVVNKNDSIRNDFVDMINKFILYDQSDDQNVLQPKNSVNSIDGLLNYKIKLQNKYNI